MQPVLKLNQLHRSLLLAITIGVLFSSSTFAQDLQELMQEGVEAVESEDWEDAVELFTEVTEEAPESAVAWFYLGYAHHANGDLDKALPAHKKSAALGGQTKNTALYNIACVYSLKNDKDKAFDYLAQAVDAGFVDTAQMKSDGDFKNIRSDKRFDEMIEGIKNPLLGDWMAKSGSQAGKKMAKERLPVMKVTSKTMTIGEGDQSFVFEYEVDKEESPMEIDLTIKKGPIGQGSKAKGIIKFDRRSIKLCYHPTDSERPKKFEATEENKFHSFSFVRKTKSDNSDGLAKWIVGKWMCTKGVKSGADVAAERMESAITFTKDMITIPIGEGAAFEMSYTIDASKKPAQIDMKIEKGPAPPGSPASGIIKRDGDKFILCYDAMGKGRPEKFESTEDNQAFYFEMKREEEK